jgi:N-acetylmuramoyl-L-alanine amidase
LNLLSKPVPALSIAVLLATLAGGAAAFSGHAQQQVPPPNLAPSALSPAPSPTLILLDPAHGGSDSGSVLGDNIAEKNITLALATRLRTALLSAGFTVVTTRDTDPTDPLTTDQRAEIANHAHALACIVLHATNSGSGIHVYTSALPPPATTATDTPPHTYTPVPWDTAQAKFIPQSLTLATTVAAVLSKAGLPTLSARAPLRPLDNLMCPAIAVEIAPLLTADASPTPVTNAAYQQQVATTLAHALRTWSDRGTPAADADNLDSQIAAQSRAIAAAGRAAAKARTATAAPRHKAPQ